MSHAVICDEPWDGVTCAGELSSVDVSGLLASAQGFDWGLVDSVMLGQLFAVGVSIVLTIGAAVAAGSFVLDVLRKS